MMIVGRVLGPGDVYAAKSALSEVTKHGTIIIDTIPFADPIDFQKMRGSVAEVPSLFGFGFIVFKVKLGLIDMASS